jgi:hypothetical protein
MSIKIEKEDIINGNIELSRSLIGDALLNPNEQIKAKKLFIAYRSIQQTLKLMGINPQDEL